MVYFAIQKLLIIQSNVSISFLYNFWVSHIATSTSIVIKVFSYVNFYCYHLFGIFVLRYQIQLEFMFAQVLRHVSVFCFLLCLFLQYSSYLMGQVPSLFLKEYSDYSCTWILSDKIQLGLLLGSVGLFRSNRATDIAQLSLFNLPMVQKKLAIESQTWYRFHLNHPSNDNLLSTLTMSNHG